MPQQQSYSGLMLGRQCIQVCLSGGGAAWYCPADLYLCRPGGTFLHRTYTNLGLAGGNFNGGSIKQGGGGGGGNQPTTRGQVEINTSNPAVQVE